MIATSDIKRQNTIAIEREHWIKALIFFSILLLAVDTVYKYYNGITYLNRQNCILYVSLPRVVFLFLEYFVELLMVVIAGIFIASLLDRHFFKLKRFIPGNPIAAFLYASVIPVCSCSVIPLIKTMRDKISFGTVMTFVIAAPLLNPYIVMLSISVLGWRYAILRVICSFILAVSAGYVANFFYQRMDTREIGTLETCNAGNRNCPMAANNVYETTFSIFKKILPFMLIAGAMGMVIELYAPGNLLKNYDLSNNFVGTVLVILVGVPVYFCNGADVLFLQPLIRCADLPLGTAMAFSLTSTSICITSLVLLVKFIGKKLTFVILMTVIIETFLLSGAIQLLGIFWR